jgi:hypothetical protein
MSEEEGKEFQEFRRSIGYEHNRESTDENNTIYSCKIVYCRA